MKRRTYLPFYVPDIGEEEVEAVREVLLSGWITTGPVTESFERKITELVGAKFALAVNSCTAGLHLALLALGVGPGDEVIIPSFTFAATANVVLHVGAKPVFADIKEDSLTLDPKDVERKITKRTKVIIPVHFAGFPADMDDLLGIKVKKGIFIVEDAAHALGSVYEGIPIGSIGDITVFSFHAVKNLTTAEGGMITTDNPVLNERMRVLSLHGLTRDAWLRYRANGASSYQVIRAGYKYNMPDVLAAIGLAQLRKFKANQRKRKILARRYLEGLKGIPGLKLPPVPRDPLMVHAWHLFVIRITEGTEISRDEFVSQLSEFRIGTSIHFQPLHLEPLYRKTLGTKEDSLPVTEKVGKEVVSLPFYPRLSEEDQDYVMESIKKILIGVKV